MILERAGRGDLGTCRKQIIRGVPPKSQAAVTFRVADVVEFGPVDSVVFRLQARVLTACRQLGLLRAPPLSIAVLFLFPLLGGGSSATCHLPRLPC